jgi:thiol peroxidase
MVGTRRTVTLKGKPLALLGSGVEVGQKAPNFKLLAIDSTNVELSQSKGKVRLLSVVHSLDTNVCDLQTQRFEEEAAKFKDVVIYAISMDLPFAQARYCGAHNIKNLQTLSDHREASFGRAYGVLIEEASPAQSRHLHN